MGELAARKALPEFSGYSAKCPEQIAQVDRGDRPTRPDAMRDFMLIWVMSSWRPFKRTGFLPPAQPLKGLTYGQRERSKPTLDFGAEYEMTKTVKTKEDGRQLSSTTSCVSPIIQAKRQPEIAHRTMSEMRWNALLGEWVVTATHRQERTFLPPPGYCPLCPTVAGAVPTEVPAADYEFVVFENKFPKF